MSDQRTHSVITSDGVTIVGTVHGQGRPLVFLQGIIGDGDIDWNLLEHLTARFTCPPDEPAGSWPQRRSR